MPRSGPLTPIRRRARRRLAVAGTVLAVASLALVTVSQAFHGMVTGEVAPNYGKVLGHATERVLDDDLDVTFGAFTVTKRPRGRGHDTALEVVVTNTAAGRRSFDIKVDALDAEGRRIAREALHVGGLAAGRSEIRTLFTAVPAGDLGALRAATFRVAEAASS